MTRRLTYTRSKGDVADEDNVDPAAEMRVGLLAVAVTMMR